MIISINNQLWFIVSILVLIHQKFLNKAVNTLRENVHLDFWQRNKQKYEINSALKRVSAFPHRSCCAGLCRGSTWSPAPAGELVGKSSQAWWRSPPHRTPLLGLWTLWHIQWRYHGFHTFSTWKESREPSGREKRIKLKKDFIQEEQDGFTWWGRARGPWFPSPTQDVYEHVQALAERVSHNY